jgi:hypothetical protein
MRALRYLIVSVLLITPVFINAQAKDTAWVVPKPYHKNVIKFNPTPMILWSAKNVTFSYERILNPKQSIALTVGYLEFPSLFKDTVAHLIAITSRQKSGINVALEYRFYLMKRNLRPIPDGLYLAPFLSFYGYQFKNDFNIVKTVVDSAAVIKGSFYIFNLGVELGYQFVFWKRFTLDLVLIGPAMSYYGGSLNITGQIDPSKIAELHQDFYDRLKEKYPGIGDFVVNKTFKNSGKLDLFSVGFRYLVQIGFHF